jgi:hypothetical protein
MSCDTKDRKAFAALHEDTDKGWVWLLLGKADGFRTRTTIQISCGERSVYCEYRELDANFVRRYDSSDFTTSMYFGVDEKDRTRQKELARTAIHQREKVNLDKVRGVIVMSDWYRKALGIPATGGEPKLTICRPWCSPWADLRAACQHPEPVVRIATRVAILGTWLGVAAFLPALAEVAPLKSWLEHGIQYPALAALVLAALFGVLCSFAARGVKR